MSSPAASNGMDVRRPRSSHKVSMTWEEDEVTSRRRMQFAEECIETKTVTTTTTTKRSYPSLFVREPRSLQSLDSKEYPLAARQTPPELRKLTFDVDDHDIEGWAGEDSINTQVRRSQSIDYANIVKSEPGVESLLDISTVRSQDVTESSPRRSRRSAAHTASPSNAPAAGRSSQRAHKHAGLPNAASDKLRRAVAHGSRANRGLRHPSAFLATPDTSELAALGMDRPSRLRALNTDNIESGTSQSTSIFDTGSPAGSESQTIFSNVATPPITDADLEPYEDAINPFQPRGNINNVAVQDASLPSPRLSPTLAAAQPQTDVPDEDAAPDADASFSSEVTRTDRRRWIDDTQTTEGDSMVMSPMQFSSGGQSQVMGSQASQFVDPRTLIEGFEVLPNEFKTWIMYQFLRRCSRKTLRVVADVVNPALKCDFLRQLPLELSLHILSYLDHRDLCRVAQVSKHWRHIADSNETGWKELFDHDGFTLSPGELDRAIKQGWGWQDPVGYDGCELDLSHQNRLTLSENELVRSVVKTEKQETPVQKSTRTSKRKRGLNHIGADRAKRRAGAQEFRDDRTSPVPKTHKSEGPISAANAAAIAVPDPQIGLPSLRHLHLFKSLYRRHYMIKNSWMNGKVRPEHVAFAAHPRHVITCLQFDEDKIITGSDDTLIHVYDTKTGELRTKLEGHEGGVWALQYEGNTLVSGSTDRSVRVWDIKKGICTQTFYGHTSTVRCLQILMPAETGAMENGKPVMMPQKPLIITGSRDSQLRIWRLPEAGSRRYIQTGPPASDDQCPYFIRILGGHTHSVRAISAHADTLVSGSYDSTVRVWKISTGEQLHVLQGHSQKVYSVVLDHKRNRCISGSMDSMVKIWDLATGACLHTLEGHSLLVGLLDLRDDWLVSAAADSTLRIWDPESGRCKRTLVAHTGAITCFQHDGAKVISGSEKNVKMWSIDNGDLVQDLLTDLSGVWQVKFDDRRCVAAVQRGNLTYIEILDFGAVRDGRPPEELGRRKLLNEGEVQRLLAEEAA
ncbi:SCF ubiquitin ligase complex subunit cdc4 [Podospora pseudopauciseta]|uniref:SCF ubiquitin ligase complex subunit cdc4 n=1 Tax=Podospora pseudopauciseta TaxID=2093780 RepID=A0ABR0HDY9_9PEZI|nr:SCF ubiquitin ligase complex subunit cdc4 [Podospora pseudopauciseta]